MSIVNIQKNVGFIKRGRDTPTRSEGHGSHHDLPVLQAVFSCGLSTNNGVCSDSLAEYPVSEWNGGKVQFIRPNVIHLTRGQIYNIDGSTFFTMGGARSHDIQDGILEPDDPEFEE